MLIWTHAGNASADRARSKDYVFKSPSGRNFTLNVCKSVTSELWNPNVDRPQDIGGFTRGDHGDISIG